MEARRTLLARRRTDMTGRQVSGARLLRAGDPKLLFPTEPRYARLSEMLILILALALARSPVEADTPGLNVVTRTCVPVITQDVPEDVAVKQARLWKSSVIWFPQPRPRGLRQYSGPYKGVGSINFSDGFCSVSIIRGNYDTDVAALRQYAAEQSWPEVKVRWTASVGFCIASHYTLISLTRSLYNGTYDFEVRPSQQECHRQFDK
jgi:hypothetical protein